MPIGGLVLTLHAEPETRTPLMAALAQFPGVTVGSPHGPRLPIVVESATAHGIDDAFRMLGELAGVAWVELAYVDYADLESASCEPAPRQPNVGGHDGQT